MSEDIRWREHMTGQRFAYATEFNTGHQFVSLFSERRKSACFACTFMSKLKHAIFTSQSLSEVTYWSRLSGWCCLHFERRTPGPSSRPWWKTEPPHFRIGSRWASQPRSAQTHASCAVSNSPLSHPRSCVREVPEVCPSRIEGTWLLSYPFPALPTYSGLTWLWQTHSSHRGHCRLMQSPQMLSQNQSLNPQRTKTYLHQCGASAYLLKALVVGCSLLMQGLMTPRAPLGLKASCDLHSHNGFLMGRLYLSTQHLESKVKSGL